MKVKTVILDFGASLLLLYAGGAFADRGAELFKERLCHTCHGEDGTHPVTEDYPVIAGQPVNYLVRQMKDIRDGRRTNGLSESMRAVVAAVTDEEFERIAEWLASRW